MESTEKNDILALIARDLAGLATKAECEELNEWLGVSEANRKYYDQLKNIWDASDKQTDISNIDISGALKKVKNRISGVKPRRKIWSSWQRIAAIIILPLAIGTFFLGLISSGIGILRQNQVVFNKVYAPYGTRSSFRLDDSTLVWLNSGSTLKYPVTFSKRVREVYLDGEAYFEVKSNPLRPFIVQTSTLKVIAKGTRFNVQCYAPRQMTEVTLVSGKVTVKETGHNRNSPGVYRLHPDQHLSYDLQTRESDIIDTDSYKYIAWKDGKLIFRNEPLSKVLKDIGLIFNVDIELQGKELQNYRYHATFEDESLEEILKLLKISAPISYTELPRNLLPDGTFSKKRIIIYPANSGHSK
ncbi:MAG TPA: FecR domain-containing protein [Bacteroidales bacterium]|nr:FecR domain-containing protein [Bacteroidales bacterium]